MPAYKIASGDLKSMPLLKHVALVRQADDRLDRRRRCIEDVQRAYDAIMPINPQLAILQCTAGYPAAFEELDLRVISTYRERFPSAVIGFSSHDNGIVMPVAAYMLGARIVEKHFTLNRAMKGTDHAFSLEPVGLRKMVRDLDRTFKAMGDGDKKIYESERAPIIKMGKSLVVARNLPSGHVLGATGHRDEVARRRHPALRARQGASAGTTLKPLHEDDFLSFDVLSKPRRPSSRVRDARRFSASTDQRSPSSPAPAASSAPSGPRRCSKPARAWRRSTSPARVADGAVRGADAAAPAMRSSASTATSPTASRLKPPRRRVAERDGRAADPRQQRRHRSAARQPGRPPSPARAADRRSSAGWSK